MRNRFFSTLIAVSLFASSANAGPYWGDFKADHCVCDGFRQYSAILWDIPWGTNWAQACYSTDAVINGHWFTGAARCNEIFWHQWGEFDVGDAACSSTGRDPMNTWCEDDPNSSDPACQICRRAQSCDVWRVWHTC